KSLKILTRRRVHGRDIVRGARGAVEKSTATHAWTEPVFRIRQRRSTKSRLLPGSRMRMSPLIPLERRKDIPRCFAYYIFPEHQLSVNHLMAQWIIDASTKAPQSYRAGTNSSSSMCRSSPLSPTRSYFTILLVSGQ